MFTVLNKNKAQDSERTGMGRSQKLTCFIIFVIVR